MDQLVFAFNRQRIGLDRLPPQAAEDPTSHQGPQPEEADKPLGAPLGGGGAHQDN